MVRKQDKEEGTKERKEGKSTDGGMEEWERGGVQRGKRKRISSILSLKAKFLLICIHAKEIRKCVR